MALEVGDEIIPGLEAGRAVRTLVRPLTRVTPAMDQQHLDSLRLPPTPIKITRVWRSTEMLLHMFVETFVPLALKLTDAAHKQGGSAAVNSLHVVDQASLGGG